MAKTKLAYTDEQILWVESNLHNYNCYKKITEDFNLKFAQNRKVTGFAQLITKRLGKTLQTQKKDTHYSKDEVDWIYKNHKNYKTYENLTQAFNAKFNRSKPKDAMREKCSKYLGIKKNNPTTFKKGNVQEELPIGTIRKVKNGTYIKNMNCQGKGIYRYQEPYWLPIQKKIWIDHYDCVPKGKYIIFLDGNIDNLDISNLYAIDRRISMVLASNKWWSNDPIKTLTAIKWCELFYTIKQK